MEFPSAIVIARFQDVQMNNNVLYRLVRPTEQGTQVVSVDRLVNVVPLKRVYRFDRKDELKEFCAELLRRPLVLQPIVHFGRGLGRGSMACGMCYKDDQWVMMVNQTHPKILSRLQIGLDAAQKAMACGQSFEVKFCFSKVVEKIYRKTLTRKEQEEAASHLDLMKTYFRYAEWEYGDLILRYHGYAALLGRGGGMWDVNTLNLKFGFEDLIQEEISWKQLGAEHFPRPHLSPVAEDEIRECLPEWTINGVSPLENIGDHVPVDNYSYAQAGRLYESFRKKKRKPRTEEGGTVTGGAPEPHKPSVSDGIELKVMGNEDEGWRQRRRYDYGEGAEDEDDDSGFKSRGRGYSSGSDGHDQRSARPDNSPSWAVNGPAQAVIGPRSYVPGPLHGDDITEEPDDGFYEEKGAKPKTYTNSHYNGEKGARPKSYGMNSKFDSRGHIYPEVRVETEQGRDRKASQGKGMSPSHSSPSQDARYPDSQLHNQFTRLRMQQGSDRSSASSGVADSGIDSEGHAREGSFDKPPPSFGEVSTAAKLYPNSNSPGTSPDYAKLAPSNSPEHPYAMLNMGFHHEEADVSEAMRKHKELVAKMMGGSAGEPSRSHGNYEPDLQQQHGYIDNRQQRTRSQSSERDAYYANGRPGHPVPPARGGGVPSPHELSGKSYSYAPTSPDCRTSGGERSPSYGYQQSSQNRQKMEESFI